MSFNYELIKYPVGKLDGVKGFDEYYITHAQIQMSDGEPYSLGRLE